MSAGSPASSFRRPGRVTDVTQMLVSSGIDAVCSAGGLVAIHFATSRGIVIVRTPLKSFLEKAQAPIDHNGRPFREPPAPTQDSQADVTATPAYVGQRGTRGRHRRPMTATELTPEMVEALRGVCRERIAGNDTRTIGQIADAFGVTAFGVMQQFRKYKAELEAQSAPVLKPSGAIL